MKMMQGAMSAASRNNSRSFASDSPEKRQTTKAVSAIGWAMGASHCLTVTSFSAAQKKKQKKGASLSVIKLI
jgi:hypothetical protein